MDDHRPRHLLPVIGLLVLAPLCAEYLYGYDDSTGDPAALLDGLIVFVPLYGCAALLIREVARRTGRGWSTMLLLGLAFGIVQAGLIDHSLFNPSYRDISWWDELYRTGLLRPLGLNPALALSFVTGHMIWSVGAPVALVEALAGRRAQAPWLRAPGLAIAGAAFLLAAAFVVQWHLMTETFRPSAGQALGAAAVAALLVVAAFRWTPAAAAPLRIRPVPAGTAVFALLEAPVAIEAVSAAARAATGRPPVGVTWPTVGWSGFVLNGALLLALAALLVRWSSQPGWDGVHRLAVAGGALLASAATAFLTEPIGDVTRTAKLAHNAVGLVVVCVLLALAGRRVGRGPHPEPGRDAAARRHGTSPHGA